MSNPVFGIQRIATLESPKVESIAYSSISYSDSFHDLVGSDPNEIRIFTGIKGGRLYESFVRVESRNDKHKVFDDLLI